MVVFAPTLIGRKLKWAVISLLHSEGVFFSELKSQAESCEWAVIEAF